MRAVIDTNLLVSAMISKPGSTSRRLLDVIRDGRLTVILSRPLIDEFLDVMGRPKFARYGITIGDVLDFIAALLADAAVVEITGTARGCDDPDDDAVIETAEVGAADYLLTGDADLLNARIRASLARLGIEVITARDFLPGSRAGPRRIASRSNERSDSRSEEGGAVRGVLAPRRTARHPDREPARGRSRQAALSRCRRFIARCRAFGAHSLRRGFVTSADRAGATTAQIMDVTGPRNPKSLRRYTRRELLHDPVLPKLFGS